LDVYSGEFSVRDVSQPTYEWLMSHRMLVGYGGIKLNRYWDCGYAAIYINASTIELRIDEKRISWDIYNHHVSVKYERFKGENDNGKITVKIMKRYATAHGRKVFFWGIKV